MSLYTFKLMKRLTHLNILLLLSIFSLSAQAVVVNIPTEKIDKKIRESFPITRQFENVTAVFHSPKALLDPLDKTFEIETQVKSENDGKVFHGEGILRGTIEYDEVFRVLQIRKPILRDFLIKHSDMPQEQQKLTSKVIQQSMARNLPKIVIVDLKKLDLQYPQSAPLKVEVASGRLTIEL